MEKDELADSHGQNDGGHGTGRDVTPAEGLDQQGTASEGDERDAGAQCAGAALKAVGIEQGAQRSFTLPEAHQAHPDDGLEQRLERDGGAGKEDYRNYDVLGIHGELAAIVTTASMDTGAGRAVA